MWTVLARVLGLTGAESRRLEIRCGLKTKDQTRKVYVHMLNGTLCATERALCCLVENYQTPEVGTDVFDVTSETDTWTGTRHSRASAAIHARPRVFAVCQRASEGLAEEAAVE